MKTPPSGETILWILNQNGIFWFKNDFEVTSNDFVWQRLFSLRSSLDRLNPFLKIRNLEFLIYQILEKTLYKNYQGIISFSF